MAKRWSESELRVGVRLLPGRDDDILNYLDDIGRNEKSYEIRKALRIYIQMQKGMITTAQIPVPSYQPVPIPLVAPTPAPAPVLLEPGEELDEESLRAALGGLLNSF